MAYSQGSGEDAEHQKRLRSRLVPAIAQDGTMHMKNRQTIHRMSELRKMNPNTTEGANVHCTLDTAGMTVAAV